MHCSAPDCTGGKKLYEPKRSSIEDVKTLKQLHHENLFPAKVKHNESLVYSRDIFLLNFACFRFLIQLLSAFLQYHIKEVQYLLLSSCIGWAGTPLHGVVQQPADTSARRALKERVCWNKTWWSLQRSNLGQKGRRERQIQERMQVKLQHL